MGKKSWTEAEDRFLRENCTLSNKKLAETLGRSVSSIMQRKWAIGVRCYPRKRASLHVDIIREFYWDKKLPLDEVGKRFDVKGASIRKFMLKHGIPLRTHSEASKLAYIEGRSFKDNAIARAMDKAEELEKLYCQGLSENEVAAEVGVKRYVVEEVFKRRGFKRRARCEALTVRGVKLRRPIKRNRGYLYVRRPEHHRADKEGYVPQHVLVWEEANNMQLPEGYVVHHFNGIKDDNRPHNLIGLPVKGHSPSLLLKAVQKKLRNCEVKLAQRRLEFGGVV